MSQNHPTPPQGPEPTPVDAAQPLPPSLSSLAAPDLVTANFYAAHAVTPSIELSTNPLHNAAPQPYSTGPHDPSPPTIPEEAPLPSEESSEDVFKRMNTAAMNRQQLLAEMRASNPDLRLTGNVISATFSVPHRFKHHQGQDWKLQPRRGQSALFDSFSYLSSNATPWDHTVVAWTGEIESAESDGRITSSTFSSTTTQSAPPLNQLSAPIPVDGTTRLPTPPHTDGLWISKEDQTCLEQQLASNQAVRVVPVWLADDSTDPDAAGGVCLKDQARWRRYAEHELYTLFHYRQNEPDDGHKVALQWDDYVRMNSKFADRVLEIYRPGDLVIVHDYYLMLLPTMLRQRLPSVSIAFFLHCPFPSSEFMRCLPRRKEILEGVLGANLVGFQTYNYARHFASCCTRILSFHSDANGVDAFGSRVQVGVFPIGIDAAKTELTARSAAVTKKYDALKALYEGKKIIVGRDRLDSARGVVQKLQAFERFLELYPEWREKVVLIQVTSPTVVEAERDGSDSKISSRVNELVMKINGDYGSLGFSPIQHYPQYLSQDEYFALLRAADIGLITSVRDGMNTTSLEYVICQRDCAGPLILSEFSGTAGSLQDAIHINPWDLNGVAVQINNALTMPPERLAAMQQSLYRHVTDRNVQRWVDDLVHRLVQVLAETSKVVATPLLDRTLMLRQYMAAGKRLFMFDYDGTLTPIVREPSAAVPSQRVIQTLRSLAADHRNAVWIISGRDQEFLQQHLGHISELGFSAEHGSFMRHPGSEEWENLAERFDMSWQADVLAVFQRYTDRVPGSFIETKRCALTWHYRQADPEQGIHMSNECYEELEATVAKSFDVEVMRGKANLEVRPNFINKGEIVKRLVNEFHRPDAPLEFVICMGDDFTDEDMFRALNGVSRSMVADDHIFTVTVGASTKSTLARWHLLEPEDVVDCGALLAGVSTGGQAIRNMGQVNIATLSTVEDHIPPEVS